MFKLVIMAIVGIAIYGGFFNAVSFEDKNGEFNVSIDKSVAIDSLLEGYSKVKTNIEENQ